MALTPEKVALISVLTDRLVTLLSVLKRVPGMTEEEVVAETQLWEDKRAEEMDELESH